MIEHVEIRHAHICGGLGGGGKGFNKATPRVGNMVGEMRCLGSVDVDPAGCRDFEKLTGTPATLMDLFDRSQYIDFHGYEPPSGWIEATPADLRRAFRDEHPHIIFTSTPCKGLSGLMSENKSKTDKYQALNRLTLRAMFLSLEAYKDDPVELYVFENVPRIATRGRYLLDQIIALLHQYGYAVAETNHDCGEIGGLAQSRKRFLLVARHMEKVPAFLYEPEKRNLQSIGSILERMPMPGDLAGGPMHRLPSLQWKTWLRLAFVEAGKDWRSLNQLAVDNGHLRDFLVVPEYHNGYMGVRKWDETSGTITGRSSPSNGSFSIADPRTGYSNAAHQNIYRITPWDSHSKTITGATHTAGGALSVADPRCESTKHNNCFRVVPWDRTAGTVTGGGHPSAGGQSVADPRRTGPCFGKYAVTPWDSSSGTVIAGSTTGQGAFAVADPRTNLNRTQGDHYLTAGHYGVAHWDQTSGAVSASACHDNGHWSVADKRLPELAINAESMPSPTDKLQCVIRSIDGTWHRPFTTLELAALQSLIEPEEYLELDGLSDQAWRERIGNAVPPEAARAIAEVMGTTLLLSWSGETFVLSSTPVWVQPIAVALSVSQGIAQ